MNRHGFFCAIWKGFLCYPLKTASRLNFCGSIFQAFQFQCSLFFCSSGWLLFATPQTHMPSHNLIMMHLQLSGLPAVMTWTRCIAYALSFPRFLYSSEKQKKADSVLLFSLLQNVCFRKFHAPAATRFVPCVPCHNPSKHLALHVLNVASYVVGDRWQGSEEGRKQGKDCFKKLVRGLK